MSARPSIREQVRYLRGLFVDPQPALDEMRAKHGPVVRLGAGPLRMAIVGDPAALREMFALPTDAFRWGNRFNVLGFVVGNGSMIVSDGADHKRRRSSVQAAFSRRRLNGWVPMIVAESDAAIDGLVAGGSPPGVVDLYPVMRRLVLRIVVRALFGERLLPRSDEIGDLFARPQAYLESTVIHQIPHPFPFTRRARVRADRRALDAVIDAEIADRRSAADGDGLDVLRSLVTESDLSDAEIRDQVVTLIGAGYDTTAATLAWMLWCTTTTPGLWARLRAEADDVYGPLTAVPDEKTLARLHLARQTVRETTRLHPAGALSPRQATRDMVLGGHGIPKGTLVLWSPHLAGRDAATWSDPLRFDPDRFTDQDPEQQALTDLAWVPFGRGARNCIGFVLAQMELTLIIARLAQRLDLEPVQSTLPRPTGMVVNRPAGGVPMRVHPREVCASGDSGADLGACYEPG